MNELSTIIQMGAIGVVNYFIANRTNVLQFNKKSQQLEKMATVAFFTGFNLLLYNGLVKHLPIYIAILLTGVLSFVITFYGLTWLVDKYKKLENKKTPLTFTSATVLDYTFKQNSNVYIFVYDFENNLIEYGGLMTWSPNAEDYNAIVLMKQAGTKPLTIEEINERYNAVVIIDNETKQKYYILDFFD